MRRDQILLVLSLICLFLLLSSSFTAISFALEGFSPISLALFRFIIASFLLFIISIFQKVRIPDKQDFPLILLCGILGIASYNILLIYGQKTTSVGLASIISNTYPIFIAIFSSMFFREIISSIKWIGIAICFSGIIVVSSEGCSGLNLNIGVLFLLLAAMIISLFDLKQKQLLSKYKPFELICYSIWSGTFSLLIFAPQLFNDIAQVSTVPLISAFYLGAFPTIVAYLLWYKIISRCSVSTVSCWFNLMPFFAMFLAFIFLHEIPCASSIIGAFIVILGLALINCPAGLPKISYVLAFNRTKAAAKKPETTNLG